MVLPVDGRWFLSLLMPPIRPGKQRGGDQKNGQPEQKFLRLEHEEEQHNPDQHRAARGQIEAGEFAEKIFNLVHVQVPSFSLIQPRAGDDTELFSELPAQLCRAGQRRHPAAFVNLRRLPATNETLERKFAALERKLEGRDDPIKSPFDAIAN